jgi:hypothetical protein
MSRPRTPTAVLELRGAFKNYPERARERAGEPRPAEPLGDPPKRLEPANKAAWREMQEHGFWLTSADQFLVEIAASLMAKHRGGTIDNPARSLLVGTLSKLGLGPAERSKMKVPPADENGMNGRSYDPRTRCGILKR